MAYKVYHDKMALLSSALLACSSVALSVGCGSAKGSQPPPGKTIQGVLELSPTMVNLSQGDNVRFVLAADTTAVSPSSCTWQAADPTILSSRGNGEFVGVGIGSSSVTAICDGSGASSSVLVSPTSDPKSIRITSGGTYSGNWSSTDPKVPAVTIITNEPVVLRNSTLSGRGDLIVIYGSQGGANVTIDNVTGTALDPGVSGVAKGKFVDAQVMARFSVTHCTMRGVSFGVYVVASPVLESLTIKDNVGINLDDRKSNGNGGYLFNQRLLGHFIQVSGTYAPNGGEIAWNQLINLDGEASIEDIISFYQARGVPGKTIQVHDNYIEGAIATGQTTPYTGTGIQMDGDPDHPSNANAFVELRDNTVVHLEGSGISIAAGHDISATGNRIISCGRDVHGNSIEGQGSVALVMTNYYQISQYFNNYMANNSGGVISPDAYGNLKPGDIYAPGASKDLNNVIGSNIFEQPCLAGSSLNLDAELFERNRWLNTATKAGELLGDQH